MALSGGKLERKITSYGAVASAIIAISQVVTLGFNVQLLNNIYFKIIFIILATTLVILFILPIIKTKLSRYSKTKRLSIYSLLGIFFFLVTTFWLTMRFEKPSTIPSISYNINGDHPTVGVNGPNYGTVNMLKHIPRELYDSDVANIASAIPKTVTEISLECLADNQEDLKYRDQLKLRLRNLGFTNVTVSTIRNKSKSFNKSPYTITYYGDLKQVITITINPQS